LLAAEQRAGVILSTIVLTLQTVAFRASPIGYEYVTGASLRVGIRADLEVLFGTSWGSKWQIFWGPASAAGFVEINLVGLGALLTVASRLRRED
jgi:hypothetical protein